MKSFKSILTDEDQNSVLELIKSNYFQSINYSVNSSILSTRTSLALIILSLCKGSLKIFQLENQMISLCLRTSKLVNDLSDIKVLNFLLDSPIICV